MMKSLRVLLVLSALVLTSVTNAPGAAADAAGPRKATPRVVVGGKRVVKAGGDSRAWTTLKAVLPESAILAGQVNVAALRGSETFSQLKRLVTRDTSVHEAMDLMASACQLDLGETIQDVAFATIDADGDHLVLALSLKGVGEADLVSCVEAAAARKHPGGRHLESRRSGGITEYAFAGDEDRFYAAWLAPDVVAFASDHADRAALAALLAQKGGLAGTPGARRAFAAVPASAVGFVVYLKQEKVDSYELRLAAAAVTLSGGRLGFEAALVLSDADSARRAAAEWAAQRDQLAAGGGVPAALGLMVKAVQIVASDDVVRVSASVPEKDFFGAFPLF